MKVTCAQCGEELIGAVNRCWRCGNHVVSGPGSDVEPPVRRAAVESSDAQMSEVDDDASSNESSNTQAATAVDVASGEPARAAARVDTAPGASAVPLHPSIPRPAYYPKHTAAAGGAVGAMVLALMSLGFSYFTIGAVFTALLGIGLGAWGVYSNYRTLSVVAMGLCCLAVVLAAIFGAIHLYHEMEGSLPFMPASDAEFNEYDSP